MIKVSNYIADFLLKNDIDTVFTVVGGGAMHLNDSFGHNKKLHCFYQHHEQACSMAAEGYTKANNKIAAVCVTSGPGAVNALNGVVGAYQDSIPMLVFSGQVKSTLTLRYNNLDLRTLGGQEFDIVSAVSKMTKTAEMVLDAKKIRYHLEKALYITKNGRPGPCWLDIPLDIQGSFVDEKSLAGFEPDELINKTDETKEYEFKHIIERIRNSRRPVFYAGNGIRLAGAVNEFRQFIEEEKIPVVTCWDSIDLIETENQYYVGRGGTMGDRPGNFAIQNSDLIIAVGNRLSIYQVGYNVETWAREAFVIDVDIDPNELKKPTIRVDMPICMDAKLFLENLLKETKNSNSVERTDWLKICEKWKKKYPVVTDKQYHESSRTNVYAFMDVLSRKAGKNSYTIVSNGSASVVGSQSYYIDSGQRFIMNCALSSMGYGLPSSIGACIANDKKSVICIEGDGSIQMNIQELQTIVTNKLPIKIFIINNNGYHQIRLTQNNFFNNGLIGVGPESKDLGFPDFAKIAWAYGIPYFSIKTNNDLSDTIKSVLSSNSFCICEVFCSTKQIFEPKSATKKLENGALFSPPLEDLAPFLSREELKENMIIDLIDET